MIGRMNLFEKKVRIVEEKMTKIIREDDDFKKDIQKKVDINMKKLDDFLMKFGKQGKELISKFDDLNDTQK